MNQRAAQLIRLLELVPHPEGGRYREIHRARQHVTGRCGLRRAAVTQIYFLLTAGEHSRWHRIDAVEIWHFYEGTALTLLTVESNGRRVRVQRLGPAARGCRPVAVVAPGCWQATLVERGHTLVGCTVAPGFRFDRFELLADNRRAEKRLSTVLGEWARLI